MRGGPPKSLEAAEHVRSEPPRLVILSEAKDLIQSPSHKNPARRANRVPVLTPHSPERDDPAEGGDEPCAAGGG